ncbi:hypothetical protein [Escherichia coli]|uniref:hypothetical protein n=1 Tax=Escherichia coli TaxID=562 RepID=UPI001629CF89|nr:hypothetical protein [Escherichia coli]
MNTKSPDDIEMSVEFTADSNSARQRETVTAPSLGAVEEISAGVYRSVLAAGSQAGTVRVTAKVQGKTVQTIHFHCCELYSRCLTQNLPTNHYSTPD